MAEILSTISIVSFVLAAVFFVLAVVFWVRFGVLGIIGDLSGRTAKKSIAKMRENNKKTGKKLFRTSSINVELEDTRKQPVRIYEKTSKLEIDSNLETGLLDDNKVDDSTENSTELLGDNDATGVLNEEGTEVLNSNANTVFDDKIVNHSPKVANVGEIKIIDEVILIHTNEVI